MNRRIANKKMMQHVWFEDHQFAVGHLSKRKNSSKKEVALVIKAIHTLHLKIEDAGGGCIIKVLNPENMKKKNIWKKKE